MILKNTDELRRRMTWHIERDGLKHMTYGVAHVGDADVRYKGCAISCCAAPHGDREAMVEFLRGATHYYADLTDSTIGAGDVVTGLDPEFLREQLADQFGITEQLAGWIEAAFETTPGPYEAQEVVSEFCEVLQDGVEITDKMVLAARKQWGTRGIVEWLRGLAPKTIERHTGAATKPQPVPVAD